MRASPETRTLEGFPEPFFIVGASRSGTTWLQRLLDSHPQILCKGEGMFFGREMKGHENAKSLYAALSNSEELRIWHKRKVWTRGGFEDFLPEMVRVMADHLFARELRKKPGAEVVGDKTPHYATSLEEISNIYPGAVILHIVRDGRDVAVSNLHNFWRRSRDRGGPLQVNPQVLRKRDRFQRDPEAFFAGGESVFTENMLRNLARRWTDTVSRAMDDGPGYFGERYLQTSYEGLLESPAAELPRVLELLGVRSGGEFVVEMVRENSFEHLSGGRSSGAEDPDSFFRKGVSGDWKNYFTERDRRVFDEEAGELLRQLGYGWEGA